MQKKTVTQYIFSMDMIARLKFISGLGLSFFLLTHLLNAALGIFGLATLEKGRIIFLAFWRSPPLYWVVFILLATHVLTALYSLLKKKTFKGISETEWLRILLGFSIPPFSLVGHMVGTRWLHHMHGVDDTYTFLLSSGYPDFFYLVVIMTSLAWIHAVISLYIYYKSTEWYQKAKYFLFTIAIVVPIISIWGAQKAGYEVTVKKSMDPVWVEKVQKESNPGNINFFEKVTSIVEPFTLFYVPGLLALFLLRALFLGFVGRKKSIQVSYLNGKKIMVRNGTTLLETSLMSNIPHAHVCGGRGRCTTCRTYFTEGFEKLPPATGEEKNILESIEAGENIRLACQVRPVEDCLVHPILPPELTAGEAYRKRKASVGTDKEIVILFSDIRGFTSMSEKKIPFDIVFILNKYFEYMGDAISENGGYIDKFIGDGIMALFGLDVDIKEACQSAMRAAEMMEEKLIVLNEQLQTELENPLKIGVGIHCGHVVVGDMGYKKNRHLTAIGDAVNTASRLESMTKEHKCKLIISSSVAERAALQQDNLEKTLIDVRGKEESMTVFCINNFQELRFD
ncbi:MAG: adenylate/guanylate cyclase domain-containing protein [bacterium]|nr:adenylate/guanylate cyclase domain-containing protein [bacterium]